MERSAPVEGTVLVGDAVAVSAAAAGSAADAVCVRSSDRAAEQLRETRPERLRHDHPILKCDDYALELGNLSALRAQINRLYVNQRLLYRDHQQLSLDDLRAALIPQGQLTRDSVSWLMRVGIWLGP